MELSALSHVKHVSISEMNEEGMITKEACLATAYLMYDGSLANTRYISTEKAVIATIINIASDSLNNVFIGLILKNYLSEDR